MRITLFLGAVILSTGCSGDDAEPCDLAHREGTYLAQYRTRSGDCGALPDAVIRLDANGELTPTCALDAPDDVSADQCSLTRSLTCAVENPDGTIQGVVITHERDGGARFEGLYTITIRDGAGAYVCGGTYDVTATRQ